MLMWEKFLKTRESAKFPKLVSLLNRLVILLPIPLSIILFLVYENPGIKGLLTTVLLILDISLFLISVVLFLFMDKLYAKSRG